MTRQLMRSPKKLVNLLNRQLGRSIIEVMIAMTISLVVLGTVLTLVAGTSRGSRTQNSQSKLTENAQVAINLITGHLRQSGFSTPRLNALPGSVVSNYEGAAVRGCSSGFINPAQPDLTLVQCIGVGVPNAMAIAYEADVNNTIILGPNQPTDCLGQILPAQVSTFGGNFFVAESRFYVANNGAGADPQLVCDGNGGPGFGNPQALIDNVEDFQVLYGVSDTGTSPFGDIVFLGTTSQYLTANQLDVQFAGEPVMTRWSRVSSVRVCLLMRTDDFVTDQATPYFDCQGALTNPPDRRMRFAVSSTVNLRNNSAVAP